MNTIDDRCLTVPKQAHRKSSYEFQMYQYGEKCMRCDGLNAKCNYYTNMQQLADARESVKGRKIDIYV